MRKLFPTLVLFLGLLLIPLNGFSQVLGPCGQSTAKEKASVKEVKVEVEEQTLKVNPVPLPGQRAIDFELTAVVGNEIKKIKLSDYQGKWRVLCFFPAAFTFV